MTVRSEEIVEAVLLLRDLNKPVDFITNQLDLSPASVREIIRTGKIPATQKTLFGEPVPQQKKKPETRVASWVQACKK